MLFSCCAMYSLIQRLFMMKSFMQIVLALGMLGGMVEVAAGAAPVNVKEHTRQVNSCLRKMPRVQRREDNGLLNWEKRNPRPWGRGRNVRSAWT